MLALSLARNRVEEHLKELEASIGEELSILDDETVQYPSGWVFYFNSKKYLEEGDPISALAGNGPLLVDKSTGEIVQFGTAFPVDEYVAYYEKTGTVLS